MTFAPDPRLPYVVTSSVVVDAERLRVLRIEYDGQIASGAENYKAPVLDLVPSEFQDDAILQTLIVTPDEETVNLLRAHTECAAISLRDFKIFTAALATELDAAERDMPGPKMLRNSSDRAMSAFRCAQEVFFLLRCQMPRVQKALPAHAIAALGQSLLD
jgi:hypothetical protein